MRIDNALTFPTEFKLRTVIWDFAGEPIPEEYLVDLHQLQEHLAGESTLRQMLVRLLTEDEIAATGGCDGTGYSAGTNLRAGSPVPFR